MTLCSRLCQGLKAEKESRIIYKIKINLNYMISSAWKAVTGNFKEVYSVVKVMFFLSLANVLLDFIIRLDYDATFGLMNTDQSLAFIILRVLAVIVTVVIGFVITFIYAPAVIRTFQKREFGEVVSMADSVAFAKTHKMEFFKVILWSGVMTLAYFLVAILPAVIGVAFAFMLADTSLILAILLGLIGGGATVYLLVKAIAKFVFPVSVYVSTGKVGRMAVQESMRLGAKFQGDALGLIGRTLVVGLLAFVVGLVCATIFLFPEYKQIFNAAMNGAQLSPDLFSLSTVVRALLSQFVATVFDILIVLPMTTILLAKAYVVVVKKEQTEAATVAPAAPEVPALDVMPAAPVVASEVVEKEGGDVASV